jgi:hypothetical protein
MPLASVRIIRSRVRPGADVNFDDDRQLRSVQSDCVQNLATLTCLNLTANICTFPADEN